MEEPSAMVNNYFTSKLPINIIWMANSCNEVATDDYNVFAKCL